nr:Chain P, Strep-tag II peptide [synthetic construct]6TIP_Q Chain Q, Strep-tag II peptide [synthetic construct]
SAWSHPQFEK